MARVHESEAGLINELDVVAVRKVLLLPEARTTVEALQSEGVRRLEAASVAEQRQVAAFQDAGWRFIPSDRAEALSGVIGRHLIRPVYRYSHGQLTIGVQRLVVRIEDDNEQDFVSRFDKKAVGHREHFADGYSYLSYAVPSSDNVFDIAKVMRDDPAISYVEPEVIEHFPARSGATGGGAANWHHRKIQLDDAWRRASTRGDVTVAVLDHGFCLNLRGFDVSRGAAWFRMRCDGSPWLVQDRDSVPSDPHGTFCASMILGYDVGVAPEAQLLPIVCCVDELTTQLTLNQAFHYAVRPYHPTISAGGPVRGADVIVCSLGPSDRPMPMLQVLRDALEDAARKGRNGLGTPVFWAVANSDCDIREDKICSSGLVIPVAPTDADDVRARQSAHGPQLAFVAPGVRVHGVISDGSTAPGTGASYAAPCAAGVAALVLSANPKLTATAVREILERTCDKVPTGPYGAYDANGRNDYYGHGRVNALRAVEAAIRT